MIQAACNIITAAIDETREKELAALDEASEGSDSQAVHKPGLPIRV